MSLILLLVKDFQIFRQDLKNTVNQLSYNPVFFYKTGTGTTIYIFCVKSLNGFEDGHWHNIFPPKDPHTLQCIKDH
jgi:hypothetical protein